MFGPLNQCDHPNMKECHPGCGHWSCDDCGLNWDDWGEGGVDARAELPDTKLQIPKSLAAKRSRQTAKTADPPPRYDDVFEQGVKWLDSL